MTDERIEQTVSTSPEGLELDSEPEAGTASRAEAARLSQGGRVLAALVLSVALTSPASLSALDVASLRRRRQDGIAAESGTAEVDVDPALLSQTRELFEQAATEFFHDGVYSAFSIGLHTLLSQHRRAGFRAIAEYLFSSKGKPDVVSEALRWLADFGDASTLPQRWAILRQMLQDPSPRVRDGALLGFAALDDPRARPLLAAARNLEQVAELRTLIGQVIAQLERRR